MINSLHICSVSQILASLRRNPFRPGTEQDLSYKPSPLLQHLRIFYITLTYSLCLAALVQFSMLPIQQLSLTYNFPFCCSHEVYFSLSTVLWLILNVAWVPGKCSWKLSDWQEVFFSHGPVSLFIFTVFFFSHFFFVFFFFFTQCVSGVPQAKMLWRLQWWLSQQRGASLWAHSRLNQWRHQF